MIISATLLNATTLSEDALDALEAEDLCVLEQGETLLVLLDFVGTDVTLHMAVKNEVLYICRFITVPSVYSWLDAGGPRKLFCHINFSFDISGQIC